MASYIQTDDLDALPDLSEDSLAQIASKCVTDLKNKDDWKGQVDGLVDLRRLAVFGKSVFKDAKLYKTLLGWTLKCLDSLRSVVSKNAALALKDLFEQLDNSCNSPLAGLLVPSLMKRASDNTNAFLRAQADAALVVFCSRCPEHETILSLEQFMHNRNPVMRIHAVKFLDICVRHSQKVSRQGELCHRLASAASDLGKDSHPEVRAGAKQLLNTIRETHPDVAGAFLPAIASARSSSPQESNRVMSPKQRSPIRKSPKQQIQNNNNNNNNNNSKKSISPRKRSPKSSRISKRSPHWNGTSIYEEDYASNSPHTEVAPKKKLISPPQSPGRQSSTITVNRSKKRVPSPRFATMRLASPKVSPHRPSPKTPSTPRATRAPRTVRQPQNHPKVKIRSVDGKDTFHDAVRLPQAGANMIHQPTTTTSSNRERHSSSTTRIPVPKQTKAVSSQEMEYLSEHKSPRVELNETTKLPSLKTLSDQTQTTMAAEPWKDFSSQAMANYSFEYGAGPSVQQPTWQVSDSPWQTRHLPYLNNHRVERETTSPVPPGIGPRKVQTTVLSPLKFLPPKPILPGLDSNQSSFPWAPTPPALNAFNLNPAVPGMPPGEPSGFAPRHQQYLPSRTSAVLNPEMSMSRKPMAQELQRNFMREKLAELDFEEQRVLDEIQSLDNALRKLRNKQFDQHAGPRKQLVLSPLGASIYYTEAT